MSRCAVLLVAQVGENFCHLGFQIFGLSGFAFPDHKEFPAFGSQPSIISEIPSYVARNFRAPIFLLCRRRVRDLAFMAVPEASMHLYGDAKTTQHYIRLSWKPGNMQAVSKTLAV